MGRRIGAAGEVLRSLCCAVVMKRELSQKAKLAIYRSIFVPTLTYGHDRKNEITDTIGQNGFSQEGSLISLRDRVRSSVIREGLGVEPLRPRPEKNASVRRDAAQSVRLRYQASEVSKEKRRKKRGGTSLNGSFIAFEMFIGGLRLQRPHSPVLGGILGNVVFC